jgi:filamentous hemagglutinin
VNVSQLSKQETGNLGESIAKDFLQQNGYQDIRAIQNASGNGVDIVARTADGRYAVFEVKSSAVGQVGDLSARQSSMGSFLEDVLSQASTGTGRYQNLDAATQNLASDLLREFRTNPQNVTGHAIGVDLLNQVLRISPWR